MVKFLHIERKNLGKVIEVRFSLEESNVGKFIIEDEFGNQIELNSKGNGYNEYKHQFVGPQDRNYIVITKDRDNAIITCAPAFASHIITYSDMDGNKIKYEQTIGKEPKFIDYGDNLITHIYNVRGN